MIDEKALEAEREAEFKKHRKTNLGSTLFGKDYEQEMQEEVRAAKKEINPDGDIGVMEL